MQKLSIGIIGCGWLGKALAKHLITNNYLVKTTVRSIEKSQLIIEQGIDCEVLDSTSDIEGDYQVFQQDVLIITITPGFKQGRIDYAENVARIVKKAEKSAVKHILLMSSTGVYQGLQGQVDELTELDLTMKKSALLYQAEQAVLNFSNKGQVLRLAGLIGEDRNPGRFLAGKTNLPSGHDPVNLVHQLDVIGVIMALIEQDIPLKVCLAVANSHPSKQVFYQLASQALSLPEPVFIESNSTEARIVNDKKTRATLNYQYQIDDLTIWLKQSI